MARQRVVLALTEEAAQVLEQSATERRRGEFVSDLLLQHASGRQAEPQAPGILERIEQRLDRIEAMLGEVLER